MKDLSDARIARLEALVARQQRDIDFLKGALEQQLRFAQIRAKGDDAMPKAEDASETIKLHFMIAGLGLRTSGRFVHAAASKFRTPIKRDARQRGRNLVIDYTRDDNLHFAGEDDTQVLEGGQ